MPKQPTKIVETIREGRWYSIPKRGLHVLCCDCGGEHIVNFRFLRGKVQYQAYKVDKK